MIAEDESFHEAQYRQQGFTVLLGAAQRTLWPTVQGELKRSNGKNWIKGDSTLHSWSEVKVEPPMKLGDVLDDSIIPFIVGGSPVSCTQWINVYHPGQYIASHIDAGGDCQLSIPIELPPAHAGGELWLGDERQVLPLALGDVLIFKAHMLRHGTTRVLRGLRTSFNLRLWLS